MNKTSNHIKNILHGFFLSIGTTIAEPSTILPLIIHYFGGSSMVVGLFSSLLRGGAVAVQLFAAFKAQSYVYMIPYIKRVFIIRFFAWFFIGVIIIFFGKDYPTFTLFCIGIGLFVFSFSAGFGAIYFKDIIAKIFTNKFRGKTMSYRQFFAGLGGLLSGSLAGMVLTHFQAPQSYGYLFVISSFVMGFGYFAFSTIDEPPKQNIAEKEKSFKKFLHNSWKILQSDKQLQIQLGTFLLSYSYLFSLPFIILDAQSKIDLNGSAIGYLITTQMVGGMLSNILWAKLSGRGLNKLTAHISILLFMAAIVVAYFGTDIYHFMVLFFMIGAAMDGNRIASGNLILVLAPEDKRPVYMALQINIISFGLFFSLLGGVILHLSNYTTLYTTTLILLFISFLLSFRLKD